MNIYKIEEIEICSLKAVKVIHNQCGNAIHGAIAYIMRTIIIYVHNIKSSFSTFCENIVKYI